MWWTPVPYRIAWEQLQKYEGIGIKNVCDLGLFIESD